MTQPKYPDIFVQLTGEDGNTGAIMGRVNRAFQQHNRENDEDIVSTDEQNAFRVAIFNCGSYDEVLRTVGEWVEVG